MGGQGGRTIAARHSAVAGQALIAAPFQPNGWDEALKSVASHTGSARGQLIAIGGPNLVPLNWVTDAPAGLTEEFVAIGGGDPKRNWRVACTGEPFEVVFEKHYAEGRARNPRSYAAFDDFMDRVGMANGCQTVLSNDGNALLGLAVLRTQQDGVTTPEQREIFAALTPFALAAVRMQHAIEHEGASLISGALETMKAAAFVCDARGRVGAHTAAAEELIRRTNCLQLAGGRLVARASAEDRMLQAALKRAIEGQDDGAVDPVSFWLRGKDGPLTSHRCEVHALPKREWSFGFEPRALVVLCDPSSSDSAGRSAIQSLLDLTPAESDVAVLIAEGVARDQIARRRGTSPDTVHAQMKSLYRKAEVTREAELVALLNRLMR